MLVLGKEEVRESKCRESIARMAALLDDLAVTRTCLVLEVLSAHREVAFFDDTTSVPAILASMSLAVAVGC